jgi:hypothetical protein
MSVADRFQKIGLLIAQNRLIPSLKKVSNPAVTLVGIASIPELKDAELDGFLQRLINNFDSKGVRANLFESHWQNQWFT